MDSMRFTMIVESKDFIGYMNEIHGIDVVHRNHGLISSNIPHYRNALVLGLPHSRNFHTLIRRFPHAQIPRRPHSQISRCPTCQTHKILHPHIKELTSLQNPQIHKSTASTASTYVLGMEIFCWLYSPGFFR